MDADTMLDILSEHGQDAGSDFDDSDRVMGWFGWSISTAAHVGVPVLTVNYEAATLLGEPQTVTRRWRLTPEEAT